MGVIDILHSLARFLPEIKAPEKPLGSKDRLVWTGLALILYFLMYQTTALGVPQAQGAAADFLQTITASRIGSLLTTGIGPIVLASIFLQLFVGAGLIKLDLKDKKDKAKFLETQKILAIILALVEASIYVIFTGMVPVKPLFGSLGEHYITTAAGGTAAYAPYTMALVVLQITLGSILVLFLDELVTKYGIGSGISLFIAAGVSLAVVVGLVDIIFVGQLYPPSVVSVMAEGGAEALPNALLSLLPFAFTILVFLVVVYAESVKVEIPIAFERVRGGGVPKLPLKFFYVSNIPVIFGSALIINLQLFAGGILLGQYWDASQQPTPLAANLIDSGNYSLEQDGILPLIGVVNSDKNLNDGFLYLLTPISQGTGRGTREHWAFLNSQTPFLKIPQWVHAIVYTLGLSAVAVVFGLFWVETANMDAKSVASQLSESGLQIPGFRRDPRMLETILNKHIFPLTVMGSLCVGVLAAVADLTGALGTGTGILLTVGILHKMYEQLEQMKTFEMYPSLSKIFGE